MGSRKWNGGSPGGQRQEVPRPRAQRMPAPPLPTLEDLPQHGVTHIRLWCGNAHRCWHQGLLAVTAIDLRQTIVDVERRLVCTRCGFIGGKAMPAWPTIGPGGQRISPGQ
jgi:hypothetical protein